MRVWDNSGEDNVLFLAGGIAFNIILAAVPFVLLIVTVATYKTCRSWRGSTSIRRRRSSHAVPRRSAPSHTEDPSSPVQVLLLQILNTRRSVGLYSAIGFVWFSTRLFGSLRTVLASVFDIEADRGIIRGKIFDVEITVVGTLLFVAGMAVTTYITMATVGGGRRVLLVTLGIRRDVMGGVERLIGSLFAFALLALMFFALYRYLPVRRVRAPTAWVAALFTSGMFEAARLIFATYSAAFRPGSLYTGTLTAIVVIVVWFYYAALIFILGGEIGQVYELRHMRSVAARSLLQKRSEDGDRPTQRYRDETDHRDATRDGRGRGRR